MQLFLVAFIVVEICEIFTVGGFPLDDAVRKVGIWSILACCNMLTPVRDSPLYTSLPLLPHAGFSC